MIALSCFFLGKDNADKTPLENWGFGTFIWEMALMDPNNIFGNPLYVRNGNYNLKDFFNFKDSYINY